MKRTDTIQPELMYAINMLQIHQTARVVPERWTKYRSVYHTVQNQNQKQNQFIAEIHVYQEIPVPVAGAGDSVV